MDFTYDFMASLGDLLIAAGPVLIFLLLLIAGLSALIGRIEGWTLTDSLYYGFVTATTVGYGDFRPTRSGGKVPRGLMSLSSCQARIP